MSLPARSLAAVLLTALTASCATTPRVDPSTEEQAIRDRDRQWVQAVAAKDVQAVVGMYAPDATFMVPNAPLASGSSAIGAMWQQIFGMPNVSVTFSPTKIEVSRAGDMAYDVGTYRFAFDGPQGRVEDEGKYTVVWRKIDGQWKVASDAFNSDKPLPPPPEPAPAPAVAQPEAGQAEINAAAGMQWTDLTVPGFRPGLKMAVIHGNPMGTADYTLRLRFPDGYEFPPHWHPQGEHVTVLQGTFMLGMGERFDQTAIKTYVPGDFLYAPPKMPHYGRVRGETIVQLHGMGPFEINLVNPASPAR
jgi:uncharacterized protein (TIGR02246 family)